MAEILNSDVKVVSNVRHNWDELLDGQRRLLKKGVDFNCQITSFRLQAYDAAKKKGMKAVVNTGKGACDNAGNPIGPDALILHATPIKT